VRIVSLISSATEMVHALGLGDFQVGRSHECDYPTRVLDLPVCTTPVFDIHGDAREIDRRVKETLATAESVYRVFDDVLERLQPTHIVTQTQCKVCAVSLGRRRTSAQRAFFDPSGSGRHGAELPPGNLQRYFPAGPSLRCRRPREAAR
jgi:iron complex transport system substrate-binding protein